MAFSIAVVLGVATLIGGIVAAREFLGWFRPKRKPAAVAYPSEAQILQTILESDAGVDWSRETRDARIITVFKRDVNLRFEIDYENRAHQKDFKEEWANRFPDPRADSDYCDLYYGTSLIRQFILVSVDGGRANLPLPKSAVDLQVTPLEYKVAEIHDTINTLGAYFARAGLRVESEGQGRNTPETPETRKVSEILRWKGKSITLSQISTAKAAQILGPVRGYAEVTLVDCNEHYATISAGGSARSIPLGRLEISHDDARQRLDLHERPA